MTTAPLNSKNIVLTGFMGVGKTAVGKILASELKRNFIDTDQLIEDKAGLTVTEIFARHGETYFRNLEEEVINSLGHYPSGSLVIATGGGSVLRESNIKKLTKNGLVILLTASPRAIVRRIARFDQQRPLLSGRESALKVKGMMMERLQYYRHHSFMIDTTGRKPSLVAREIIEYLKSH